jgi:hypothetical protein
MTWVMLIAPGHPNDRLWFDLPQGQAVQYLRERIDITADDMLSPLRPDEFVTAPMRRMRARGWRVVLNFLAADPPPAGYAMPGWVQGEQLEAVPVCTWCYGHVAPLMRPIWNVFDRSAPWLRHTEEECRAEKEERRRALIRITGI